MRINNATRDKKRFPAAGSLIAQMLVATCLSSTVFAQANPVEIASRARLHHKTSSPKRLSHSPRHKSDAREMIGKYTYSNRQTGLALDLFDNRNYKLFLQTTTVNPSDMDEEGNKSYGTWRLNKEGNLVLTPQDTDRKLRYLSHPATYYPVHWGTRTYILSETDFSAFKKAIDSGEEPRDKSWGNSFFLLSLGDEKKTADGLPVFPERWRNKNKTNTSVAKPILKSSPNPIHNLAPSQLGKSSI